MARCPAPTAYRSAHCHWISNCILHPSFSQCCCPDSLDKSSLFGGRCGFSLRYFVAFFACFVPARYAGRELHRQIDVDHYHT
ncbi:hypothetical protein EJ02DRAFT_450987 [Clathrospora elynae]|uniref:Uncharacterized protein n=1 Tax=Clathrospora elynae TaxID=706981 RepID=A0A6A5T0Z7_9PLEO|nr:hypothetical protein EJ02DRAFT_450987 [Clathrospora elynae]